MILQIVSYVLIGLGLLMAGFGVLGLFRFKVLYLRLLVSSNIDVVGMLLMMVGMMIISNDIVVAMKIVIICILSLFTSPLSSHAIAESAYESGYRNK